MAPATLRIWLFGELDLRLGEEPLLPLGSARAESLLAYLLLHREAPQPRQRLAFLLWPDSSEPQARTNLRHLLHVLRRALPDADRYLEVTPRTLRWREDAPWWLDVAAFEEAVARAGREPGGEREPDGGGELPALRKAVGLYRGDLLEGGYDEWLLDPRERLRQDHLQVLERLVELLETRGELAEAIGSAERLLLADPLREATYRVLMRLHDARGDRARALRAYHACAAALERELSVEPSAPTRRAYEALLPSQPEPAAGERPARLGPVGAPPLIGRAAQRARLAELWRASERGAARLVLVTGEPGAGKTRLVEELRSWCIQQGAATAEARSYPAEGALAYGPVVAWLRSPALAAHLQRLDPSPLVELARLLPELRPLAPGPPAPDLPSGPERRRVLFEALAEAVAVPGPPLLLVADDLQWADTETLQFLHFLLRARPQAPLLVAATAREEHLGDQPLHTLRSGLQALERLSEVEVGRLSGRETAALAERLAGHELAEAEAERLFAETEGNPLFVIEALRAGWRGRSGQRGPITPRVQAVIESRLAQLSAPARDLVGVAATIGREFSTDVLAQASEADEQALVGALDELWRRRLVRDRGPDAYDFTHDRIREVAYLGLSPARRRQSHLRVARALERLHADDPAPVAAQLAAHLERAGALEDAVAWYERGAGVAQRLGANVEAARLLERALRLLQELPRTPARQERELAVVTRLQAPLGIAEGYASDRLAEAQRLGLELAALAGVEPGGPLLLSLAVASLARGDFEGAQRVGERLRAGGAEGSDDVRRVEGEYVLGIAAFWRGEFGTARRHFEAAVAGYRAEHRPAHLLRFGIDLEVVCVSRLGNTLWFLGHPDAAIGARDAALALAEELGHAYSRATALVFAAMLALDLRDPVSVRSYTAALAARPTDQEPSIRVPAGVLAGYVDVLDGRAAGLARIWRALDDPAEGEHAPGLHAIIGRVLLEACAAAGDARAGLAAADRVLAVTGNVRTWEAEAHRLKGEFLAGLGAPAGEVEAELERAAATARRQGARMLELRAAASLLRHRLDRDPAGVGGQPGPARDALAAAVAAVPEGHDTPDLGEALALLARS
jgi:DNA-binding SARP family transcriptional activator